MSKLLRAEYARMFRSKVFWCCIIFSVAYALFVIAVGYHNVKTYSDSSLVSFDECFFFTYGLYGTIPIPGIIMAVFTCLFLGPEYDEGTIRNKLVVGHGRVSIYLCGFLCLCGMGLMIQFSTALTLCAAGMPLFGFFQMPAAGLLPVIVNGIFMVLSYASVFTLLSVLLQNKTSMAVVGILMVFCAFLVFSYLRSRLSEPPMQEVWEFISDGGMRPSGMEENPRYLDGMARSVCEIVLRLFPTGQSIQLSDNGGFHGWILTIYSMLVIFITNAAGLFLFRRRDLK